MLKVTSLHISNFVRMWFILFFFPLLQLDVKRCTYWRLVLKRTILQFMCVLYLYILITSKTRLCSYQIMKPKMQHQQHQHLEKKNTMMHSKYLVEVSLLFHVTPYNHQYNQGMSRIICCDSKNLHLHQLDKHNKFHLKLHSDNKLIAANGFWNRKLRRIMMPTLLLRRGETL